MVRFSRCPAVVCSALLLSFSVNIAPSARAQAPAGTVVYSGPPSTLQEAILRSQDVKRRRVPLLAIGADKWNLPSDEGGAWGRLHALYSENAVPPLRDAVALFNRQVISCGSVQVVAPTYQVRLNLDPGPATEWAKIGRQRAARLLFGSLTTAQWSRASSADGLALSDLKKEEQRGWFRSLIPDPFVLERAIAGSEPGSIITYGTVPDPPPGMPETVTLAPDQVRLRLRRTINWMYKQKRSDGAYNGFGMSADDTPWKPGEYFYHPKSTPAEQLPERAEDRMKEAIRQKEENRLKRSDLPLGAPPLVGKTISLADATTVGEVVRRIADATGIELYADRRVSGLTVSRFGDDTATQADAGDALRALCYALAATVRRIDDPDHKESVYLLTGDRQGLITQRVRLAEWADDIQALTSAEQTTFDKGARDKEVVHDIGFAPNSALSVSENGMRAAEQFIIDPPKDRNQYSGYIKVPVTELSPAGKQQVERDMKQQAQWSGGENTLDDKNVYATFGVSIQLVAPGYGAFSGPSLSGLNSLLKPKPTVPAPRPTPPTGPFTLPAPLRKFAALQVTLRNDDEAEKAVLWARKHGFTALLVNTSLWDTGSAERLAAVIALGKRHGIEIYPAVSLLRVPVPKEGGSGVPDWQPLAKARNILGETLREHAYRRIDAPAVTQQSYWRDQFAQRTSDWFDVNDAATRSALAERLKKVVQTAGIAGLLLTDVAAPGMAMKELYTPSQLMGTYGGYTPALRVALIRKENMDPVDLPPPSSMAPYIYVGNEGLIPYFSDSYDADALVRSTPAYRRTAEGWRKAELTPSSNPGTYQVNAVWNALRREENQKRVGEIRQAAQLAPTLPIYISAPGEINYGALSPWTRLWAADENLLPLEPGSAPVLPLTMSAASTPDSVRFGLSYVPKRISIKREADGKETVSHSGVLIDASALPVSKALSLLSVLSEGQ